MLNLESGDRIELFYKDAPATTIRATVDRALTGRDEGMGIEIEDYTACWIEISWMRGGIDAKQVVLLGTDSSIGWMAAGNRKTQELLVGEERTMRIGIIGAGEIGGTLTRRLEQLGHEVFVANSRGPSSWRDWRMRLARRP